MSRWWWSLLLVLTLRAECRAKSTVNVPLEHPSYAFVERFEARGVLGGKVGGIRPFSRAYMARLFAVVRTSVQGGTPISPIELKRLKQYEDEFAAELGEQTVSGLAQRTRLAMPLFRYLGKEGDLFADLLFRQRTDRFTGNGRQEPEYSAIPWGESYAAILVNALVFA